MRVESGTSVLPIAQAAQSTASTSGGTAKARPANPELDYLSRSDVELVYQATGKRVDASSELVPMFAVQLANDRRYGNLPAQGPVPAAYLTNLITRYADSPWMVDQASRALEWVQQRGGLSGVDVTA